MPDEAKATPTTMSDLLTLTKFRLSVLVIVSTFVGFWLACPRPIPWMLLIHTIIGSTLAAFGAVALLRPEEKTLMQYTTTSTLLHQRLGIA
jgi:heme O synthase-like polyprenyltransferase